MRIALGIAYDGRPWQGWQTQPHGRTVQDTLLSALQAFAHHPVELICAGRTDTGVHAVGQVVHLDTPLDRRMESWVRGLNAHLPDSVAVLWAQVVAPDFHARFSAQSRTYHYVLHQSRVRSPLWAGRAGWAFRPLDIEAMRTAAQVLLGTHDFSSFRSSQCQAAHPVRTMHQLDIESRGERDQWVVLTFRANAFLHHMVRNIVGALVLIGQGRQQMDMAELLAARDRTRAAPTFAADGLYLAAAEYPREFGLPEQDADASLLPLIGC
ncbi:MAG: tRNA pseudouridine(38-40) synthase TruA [Corticimicrobacter sp.]|uniref:tRNA pseudouridine(38-40) synthase TruA n=1 Tax=Corticimicrobacter sp. TaxID=2678536 RepID=UPI0032DA6710